MKRLFLNFKIYLQRTIELIIRTMRLKQIRLFIKIQWFDYYGYGFEYYFVLYTTAVFVYMQYNTRVLRKRLNRFVFVLLF